MMPDRVRRLLVPALATLALICASPLQAGGFRSPKSDVVSAGIGGASVAHPTGAASQFDNVAGLAFVGRSELSFGGIGQLPFTKFSGANPYPGVSTEEQQTRKPLLLPTFAYAQPLSSTLVVGLGIDVPFDLHTTWETPAAFSGRFVAQDASLRCYSFSPSVAWKLADRLAVGGGLDVNVASLDLHRRLPAINPFTMRRVDAGTLSIESDATVALGLRAGLLARISEAFAVGIAYRQSAPFDLTGTGSVARLATGSAQLDNKLAATFPPGAVAFTRDMTLPATLTAGVAYTWNDWTLAAEVAVESWSTFDELAIEFAGGPDLGTTLARAYKDTRPIRVGVERRVSHAFTVRCGYSYEPTPMPVDSLSPVLFDSNRHGLALGATVARGTWRIDLSSGVTLFSKRATEGTNPEGFDGTYKSTVPILGLAIVRTF